MPELTIAPPCVEWTRLARSHPGGSLFGHSLEQWRVKTRRELGLDEDRPIIATGHQTLLWHPGILVKYLLTDAVARTHGLAQAQLVVDQHVGDFGVIEVPVRRAGGALAVRRIELARARPEVPMGLHPPFVPEPLPHGLPVAGETIATGLSAIHAAIAAHQDAPNAAQQMGGALDDLMQPWIGRRTAVGASELVETSLARALLGAMADDPWSCAAAYNAAVKALPEAGIPPLLVRDDYVELPLWRIRDDGRRMRAYDADVVRLLDPDGAAAAPRLLPRALFMTALLRLGMCDLFVHGVGGANYDRAMVGWIRDWLGLEPAPIVVASATLRLPLVAGDRITPDVASAVATAHRIWHDPEPPEAPEAGAPGPTKREFLRAIERAPRRSRARRLAFGQMHQQLDVLRSANAGRVEHAQRQALTARRRRDDDRIASRRDWAFPLYPPDMIDELAAAVRERVAGERVG